MKEWIYPYKLNFLAATILITGFLCYGSVYGILGYAKENTAEITLTPTNENPKDEISNNESVLFYISKLKDKEYISTYGHGYTWYIAAEELGNIGKPAIPYLIEKLDTRDDYERAVTFYALLLASQHKNVRVFTNGEYIRVPLEFDAKKHPALKLIVEAWWEKYKNNW